MADESFSLKDCLDSTIAQVVEGVGAAQARVEDKVMRRHSPPGRLDSRLLCLLVLGLIDAPSRADYWTQPMRKVHASFSGRPGTIARFGDSISVSQAYFVPLGSSHDNAVPETQSALDWIQGYVPADVWAWQSESTGASGGKTSAWPLESGQNPPTRNIDFWLDSLNPEMAIIMWGTNDLPQNPIDVFITNMREVITAVKSNGTIPILLSIPPRNEYESASDDYASALADLAFEQGVPLLDYHHEILTRAPGDLWNGALVYDGEGSPYEVERLIAGDGVHPSNPTAFRRDFSEAALNKNGFTLLNYLALSATYQVYQEAIEFRSEAPAGDFNIDAQVDAADYAVWRNGLGTIYDQDDYLAWRANYGATTSASAPAPIPIPTPATLPLLTLACVGLGMPRRARVRPTD